MIRVIIEIADAAMAANVGGPVHTRHLTIDVNAPEVETALQSTGAYDERRVIGVEVLRSGVSNDAVQSSDSQ